MRGCTSLLQMTHSLKVAGFNPCAYKVKSWFQAFAFDKCNLYRYIEDASALTGVVIFNFAVVLACPAIIGRVGYHVSSRDLAVKTRFN
jgi:hypothetical protein